MKGTSPRTLRSSVAIAAAFAAFGVLATTASATTLVYGYGSDVRWFTPTDTSSALVQLQGGEGGDGYGMWYSGGGGQGGAASATVDFQAGSSYGLLTGADGEDGGAPGGGTGSSSTVCPGGSCGGGGMTIVGGAGGGATIFAAGDPGVRSNYLLVAGGGGGAGALETPTPGGKGGGLSGGAGSSMDSCQPGQGGDQTGSTGSGQPLTGGNAGQGASGGGGGGYYGGAGGGTGACGGGGGSGYIAPSARNGSFEGSTGGFNGGSAIITYFPVNVGVTGSGSVSASGIACGSGKTDCLESFAPGDKVTLTARPRNGNSFGGFSGAGCGKAAICQITVSADTAVSADFITTRAPNTKITKAPGKRTSKKRVKVSFSSSMRNATYECAVNGGEYAACTSPATVKSKRGKNKFAVRAVVDGRPDRSPAKTSWKLKPKKRR
jgi:hypothetical protein